MRPVRELRIVDGEFSDLRCLMKPLFTVLRFILEGKVFGKALATLGLNERKGTGG